MDSKLKNYREMRRKLEEGVRPTLSIYTLVSENTIRLRSSLKKGWMSYLRCIKNICFLYHSDSSIL